MNTRTDIHSPANLKPEDYTFIGWYYLDQNAAELNDPEVRKYVVDNVHVGVHPTGQCDHCGSGFTYGAIFQHVDGGYIQVGHQCANGRFETDDRFEYELRYLRNRVANHRDQQTKLEKFERLLEGNPILREAFDWARKQDEFLDGLEPLKRQVVARAIGYNVSTILDIRRSVIAKGSISLRQELFVPQLRDEGQERLPEALAEAERVAALQPLEAGRQEVTGEIVGFKTYENAYGSTLKVLVQLESGHKVFGTLPSSIDDAQRGDVVTFTANLEPKSNDFATFSRPTKARYA